MCPSVSLGFLSPWGFKERCWLALHVEGVLPALEGKGKSKGEGHGLAL